MILILPYVGSCTRCTGAPDSSWSARGTPVKSDGDVERLARSIVVKEGVVDQYMNSCVASFHDDP